MFYGSGPYDFIQTYQYGNENSEGQNGWGRESGWDFPGGQVCVCVCVFRDRRVGP